MEAENMKIGIIGAENSHTAAIAHTLNVKRAVRGFQVDCVWGETAAFAAQAAEKGRIPTIVRTPREMLGKIDALIVDHRHAKYHLGAARPFLDEGLPIFIDKPFCFRAAEGKEFLGQARRKGVPVTSFGVLPEQAAFRRLKQKAAGLGEPLAVTTFGPCDLRSKYGGIFFYGIHQVEMVLELCGCNVSSVVVTRNRSNAAAQLLYADGRIATMHLVKAGCPGFGMTVLGTGGQAHAPIRMDADPYLTGIRKFTRMFRTGEEPLPHERLLAPIRVLEALERSVASGTREKVR
jgi:predicted dehydrogenase